MGNISATLCIYKTITKKKEINCLNQCLVLVNAINHDLCLRISGTGFLLGQKL